MKPVKLNQKQLRSLISEAIQLRQPGQPEPFQLNEEFDDDDPSSYDDTINVFADALAEAAETVDGVRNVRSSSSIETGDVRFVAMMDDGQTFQVTITRGKPY